MARLRLFSHCGPPRRPHTISLNYRLKHAQKELSIRLDRVNVWCEVDNKESLEWSFANNQTELAIGSSISSRMGKTKDLYAAATMPTHTSLLVGQLVGIHGLKNRKDLNGRIGQVIKWHASQSRWQVKLHDVLSSESEGGMIAIKPDNLCPCPQGLTDVAEYFWVSRRHKKPGPK